MEADEQRAEAVLAGLDAAQRHAVTTPSTLVAVIAAAGSGKTRVLTRRIAHRVAVGSADARATLALTFTREAAGELRRRLRRSGLREPVEAGTFHAVALGLLRQRWQDQGRPAPAIVEDRERLLREVADGAPVSVLSTEAAWAAARGIPPGRYAGAARAAGRRTAVPADRVAQVLVAYDVLKRRRGVVDLDDLIVDAAEGLAGDERWAEAVRFRFRHVLVDEAQDLNPLQFRLLRALVGERRDLFLVGDPAQAIYGFNGSDPALLVDVERALSGVEVVRLDVNHRCTPQIVAAGGHVLRATGQPAEAVSARADGPAVRVSEAADADEEAALVARIVGDTDPGLIRTGQVGVLARTNAQLATLRAALERAGIPVRQRTVPAGSPLAVAVRSATAAGSAGRLRAWAHDVLDSAEPPREHAAPEPLPPAEAATVEAERRLAAVVLDYLRDQPTGDGAGLRAYLATTGALVDGPDAQGVDLLTFHAAKGREWDTVVVTGAESSLVPHRSATTTGGRAEEARLLHVALTRASEQLHVTWARRRGGYARTRSPFLDGFEPGEVAVTAPMPDELRPPEPHRDPGRGVLVEWRALAARAADVSPEALATDAELGAIVAADPRSPEALAVATGWGAITAARLFAGIRAALDGAAEQASQGSARSTTTGA